MLAEAVFTAVINFDRCTKFPPVFIIVIFVSRNCIIYTADMNIRLSSIFQTKNIRHFIITLQFDGIDLCSICKEDLFVILYTFDLDLNLRIVRVTRYLHGVDQFLCTAS